MVLLLVLELQSVGQSDLRLHRITVNPMIGDGIEQAGRRRERDIHSPIDRQGNPRLGAGAAFFGEIPVRVSEVATVNLEGRHALPDRVSHRHCHAIREIRLPKSRNADGAYFIQGIIVRSRHNVPAGDRGNHWLPPAAEKIEQPRLEVLLLLEIVHPEHYVVLDGVGHHVDRPEFIGPLRRTFLGQGFAEQIDN